MSDPQVVIALHSSVTEMYLWSFRPLTSQFPSCALCWSPLVRTCNSPAFIRGRAEDQDKDSALQHSPPLFLRYWGGAECNVCEIGYWGLTCANLCDCNGHGSCGWLDGVCECYQDDVNGFWAGAHCEVCTDGYLEPVCRARNVAISRPREVPAITQLEGAGAQSAMVSDEAHRLLYTGGQPLLVLDTDTNAIVASFSLGGVIRCAPESSSARLPPPKYTSTKLCPHDSDGSDAWRVLTDFCPLAAPFSAEARHKAVET